MATKKPDKADAYPRDSVATLIRRSAAAWQVREQWQALIDDCFDYAMPNRKSTTGALGGKKADKVFDSTGVQAASAFANRLQSDLCQPFKKWMKLAPGPMVPENLKDGIARQLEEVTDRMFAFIHASNFDTSINEVFLDLGIGTGAMLVLEGDTMHPLNFVPVSIAQIALEAGPWGGVGAVFRKHKCRIDVVKRQWRDVKNLPDDWARILADKPETEVELIEATYFMDYGDGSAQSTWCYDVIAVASKARIVERNYPLNPWVTPRWMVCPGEVFGRGPLIHALPDIKTLNKIVELVLRNAALHVSGVYTGVDDGVLNPNTAQIIPGGIISVASNGGPRGPSLMALERSGSLELANFEIEKLRLHIQRQTFDQQLPPEAGPVRSATEIVERIKQLARDIGSPFGRMYSELLVPTVQNVLQIMATRGLTPRLRVDGLAIQVQIISPLAQEQSMAEVEAVVRWLSILGALGKELVMLAAKTEDLGQWIGDKLGVPASLMREKKDRDNVMDDIKQMMASELVAKGGSNVVPIGAGVPYQQVQTSAAAAGVQPFARAA